MSLLLKVAYSSDEQFYKAAVSRYNSALSDWWSQRLSKETVATSGTDHWRENKLLHLSSIMLVCKTN